MGIKPDIIFSFILVLLITSCNQGNIQDGELIVFQSLDSQSTGVNFINTLKEDNQLNYFMWGLLYNGAGVAIGDINNDGLSDILFSGNMVDDCLFLNKGKMQFENINAISNFGSRKGFSSGITVGDVNGDGFLDVYICRYYPAIESPWSQNILYINNGNLTFTEASATRGVNDRGFSTQSSFFDADNDGDLDLYVVNQPPDIRLVQQYGIDINDPKYRVTDQLYLNDGKGYFTNITSGSGIENGDYGLNVITSDIDNDGHVDIYISSDYDGSDHLYINNGDLTFTDRILDQIKHISNFSMGADIADINNDGHLDISVVDMAASDHIRSKTNMGSMRPARFWNNVDQGKHYQYMHNTLQLNNGNNTFSEISHYAGVAKTDWSWGTLLFDIDNDGFKDMMVTNGIFRDVRNNDYQNNIRKLNAQGVNQFDILEILKLIPSNPLPNYAYQNDQDLGFIDKSVEWGISEPGFSNGIAYGDLDNDGDLDVVTNNFNSIASIYQNNSSVHNNFIQFNLYKNNKKEYATNAKVTIKYEGKSQIQELTFTRGFYSSSDPKIHFGLEKTKIIDTLIVQWPDGKVSQSYDLSANSMYNLFEDKVEVFKAQKVKPLLNKYFSEDNNMIDHMHKENDFDDFAREILLPHKLSENGPIITSGDVDGDGINDVFIGGSSGLESVLYLQSKDGKFLKSRSQPWITDKEKEDLGSLFFDFDNDNDLDLYIVSGGSEWEEGNALYEDRLYQNDGKGNFTKTKGIIPAIYVSGQVVKCSDIDQDGDLDLFIGGRVVPGKYPKAAKSYILENHGDHFEEATKIIAPELMDLGLVTDAVFTDIDNDQDDDLIIVGEWMPISVFINNNGKLSNETETYKLDQSNGWWWSVESADLDLDGDQDLVVGNLGLNNKFHATVENPFKIYADDFDSNGTNDVFLAKTYGDKIVPVRGRECSSEQIPEILERFPSYQEFAEASLDKILEIETGTDMVNYEVNSFASLVLINNGQKGFEIKKLPPRAQLTPIRDIIIHDVNEDSYPDLIFVGNMYGTEVETSRYDAGTGNLLLGSGDGNFKNVSVDRSGFFTSGDARSMSIITSSPLTFFVGNNNGKVQVFRSSK